MNHLTTPSYCAACEELTASVTPHLRGQSNSPLCPACAAPATWVMCPVCHEGSPAALFVHGVCPCTPVVELLALPRQITWGERIAA